MIVDDDPDVLHYLSELLAQCGHDAESVDRADAASRRIDDSGFDLVISDIEMPGRSGLELAEDLRRQHPRLPVILTTGSGDQQFLRRSHELGAGFLTKPFTADRLLAEIDQVSGALESSEIGLDDD